LQISPYFISHLSASLFLSAAGAERRRPPPWKAAGHLLLSVAPTHRAQTPRHLPSLSLDLPSLRHASPAIRAAATSPPPWPARCSTPDPHLSHAPAPRAPQQPNPLAHSLAPSPEPPEHRSRPAQTPASSKLTVDPPFPTSSACADPISSSASSSRSSQTSPPRPEPTGAPSPPFSSAALLAADPPPPTVPDPAKHTYRCALTR